MTRMQAKAVAGGAAVIAAAFLLFAFFWHMPPVWR